MRPEPPKPRICVVTAGHLSGCPRMLKAADALHAAGYSVRVVSTRYVDWSTAADQEIRRSPMRRWRWTPVSFERNTANWLRSGLRHRAAHAVTEKLGAERVPISVAIRARGRFYSELVEAVCAEPTDLIYGGTGNIPPVVAAAARRLRVPFAIDLEDFHSEECDDSATGRLDNALSARIERVFLPEAAFLTAGSSAIRDAYVRALGVGVTAIHNTFPLPAHAPSFEDSAREGLALCWFSQTIGAGRGLEEAVRAVGAAKIPARLHLRGVPQTGYLERIYALAREVAPALSIAHDPPIPPDDLVESCRSFDVGLALERPEIGNRALCLTNKALTYPLAGLAVLMTDTLGQHELGLDLGDGALVAKPGDIDTLAEGLRHWSADRGALRHAREAAWAAAQRRWHWEHPFERGALLAAIAQAVGS